MPHDYYHKIISKAVRDHSGSLIIVSICRMLEATDLMGRRIAALERSYFGNNANYDEYLEPGVITTKLDNIDVKLAEIDHQIPALKASHNLLLKLKPVILERKSNLSGLLRRVDSIIANKASIAEYIEDLHTVERLSYAVNSEHFQGKFLLFSPETFLS